MKKSEEIRQKASATENDLAYLGLANKVMREVRSERFEDKWVEKFKEADKVLYIHFHENMGKYTIDIRDFGLLDYYPKANKVLIRKTNKWIKPGLRWLIKNYINDN